MNTSNVDTTKIDNKSISDTLPIPLEKIPEWNQEERMRALFSPFRSRSANSQDWISKYKFWHNLIYEWLKHTMQCSFSIADLSEVFKRKGCAPLCLATVIEELLRYSSFYKCLRACAQCIYMCVKFFTFRTITSD